MKRRDFLLGGASSLVLARDAYAQILHGVAGCGPGMSSGMGVSNGCEPGATGALGLNRMFGVNLSGAEYSSVNFPSAADISYIASLGVSFVRLPVAWESLQTTLGGSLVTSYVNNLKSAIAALNAHGIGTIVDLHNFGHYAQSAVWGSTVTYAGNAGVTITNVNTLGDGTLTSALFSGVWTSLATALVGTAGLIGYGLMNEPANIIGNNLLVAPNYPLQDSRTPWFVNNGCTVTALGAGTNPLGGASQYGQGWDITSGTGFGSVVQDITVSAVPYTLSAYAKVTSGSQPLVLAIGNVSQQLTVNSTSWSRFTFTGTPTAGSQQIQIGVNQGTAGNHIQIANMQLEAGSSASSYAANPYLSFAQAAINAIRAVDTTTPIYVCGYNFSAASAWQIFNYEMAQLTGSNLIFEAHQYFDGAEGIGGGGNYSGTFTSYSVDTSTAVNALAPFTNWLTAVSGTGFLGEFGVPNDTNDNDAQWLPTQLRFVGALRAAGVRGAQWFYGNNGIQSANNLNIGASTNDQRLLQMLTVR